MKKLLLILLCLPFIGFGQIHYIEEFHENGKLSIRYGIKDYKFEGPFKSYYKNGQLKAEGMNKNDNREGFWKFYHENGKLDGEGNFNNDKKEGLWKYYHENGQLAGKVDLKDGQIISKKCWDENGDKTECKGNYFRYGKW